MDIKEINKKLQFEFLNKHYLSTKKAEQIASFCVFYNTLKCKNYNIQLQACTILF